MVEIEAVATERADGSWSIELPPMRVIVKRIIVGPDAPELGTVVVVSASALTVPLARPSTGPTQIDYYELDRLTSGSDTWVSVASGLSIFGASGYPDTGLAESTTYTYRCRAIDTTGRASPYVFSSGTTSSIPLPPPAPDTPVSFVASRASATEVNLSWAAGPTGAAPTDYDLDYSTTSSSGPWTSIPFTGTATTYAHTGLTNVQYWYRVRASASGEVSGYASATAAPVVTTRNVHYSATWSSAGVASAGDLTDGGRFSSKYEPEGGVNAYSAPDEDLPKTASNLDQRVASSVTYQGETITARTSGGYFLQQAIYYTKEYESIQGNNGAPSGSNDSLDKPRTYYDLTASAYECDFDREVWFGFSFYVHPDHVHDTRTRAHQGRCNIFNCGAGDNFSQFRIQTGGRPTSAQTGYIGGLGGNTEHYLLGFQTNATAVADMAGTYNSKTTWVDLGDMDDDLGLWTDFVIRFRLNPFASTTNPGQAGIANAKNHSYAGNKGIMQVWKSTGPYLDASRNRAMTRVFNLFNAPVGGVPHATLRLEYRMGLYKYGWKNNATDNTGWIYYGLDELRFGHRKALESGEVHAQFGTKDIDVNPSGLPLTGWSEQS